MIPEKQNSPNAEELGYFKAILNKAGRVSNAENPFVSERKKPAGVSLALSNQPLPGLVANSCKCICSDFLS